MRVGFLNNQIDNRGTGNALFDYAHYNEEILGNQSIIITLDKISRDFRMENRLLVRFGDIYSLFGGLPEIHVLYHIQYGTDPTFIIPGAKSVIHAVFDASQPHGDRYATVSKWMSDKYNVPYVPHIVEVDPTYDTMHDELHIPRDLFVFGRYGGHDSFDLPFAWEAIEHVHNSRSDVFFLFMNTYIPSEYKSLERVLEVPATGSPYQKKKFINTCTAMLHARGRGETFGLAVGEFSLCEKPIITYDASPERAHLELLGPRCFRYSNKESLIEILNGWGQDTNEAMFVLEYAAFNPYFVMKKFKEVFLD